MMDKSLAKKALIMELFITIILTVIIFMVSKSIVYVIDPNIYLQNLKDYSLYWLYASFLVSYVFSILLLNPIVYLFEKSYLKKHEIKSDNIKFKYYRDIIKNYSVATICTCYGKKIKIEDLLVAIMLSLKINGNIELNSRNIIVKNELVKYKSEKMLIKAFNGISVYSKENLINEIGEDILDDCMKSDLFISDKTSRTAHFKDSMAKFAIVLWLINMVSLFFIRYLPLMIVAFVFHFIVLFMIIHMFDKDKVIFVRNEKGIEMQKKLCALKSFLEDYGNISEKEIKEIELYEDYILYAIIFDLKGNLNKEAKKLYNKYIKSIIC